MNNRWFRDVLAEINRGDLNSGDLEQIITNTISEYINGSITLETLLEVIDEIRKNYQESANPELQNILIRLSSLALEHDKELIYRTFIAVLKKIIEK